MKHSLPLVTIACLASLSGCATLPEDDIDQVEQSAVLGPQPSPGPNPCLDGAPDAVFTLPSPLTSSVTYNDMAASVATLAGCDHRVVEYRNVTGHRQITGFFSVGVDNTQFPDMTEADCAASLFSGWVSVYHPPSHGAEGSWETIESMPALHARWRTWPGGSFTCEFDPNHEILHTFDVSVLTGVTRTRVGSRLKIRHGGVWTRDAVRTQAYFTPPG